MFQSKKSFVPFEKFFYETVFAWNRSAKSLLYRPMEPFMQGGSTCRYVCAQQDARFTALEQHVRSLRTHLSQVGEITYRN